MNLFDDQDDIIDDENYDLDTSSVTHSFCESIANKKNSLTEPKGMTFCLGHEEQEALFIDLYKKNSVPHAMIFYGLEGIGKTTMAFRLARFLLKNGKREENNSGGLFGNDLPPLEISSLDVSPAEPVFSRVASGGHADLLHIYRGFDKTKGKQNSSLKVEEIRTIEPFLRKTASEGGWRIVVVEDADTMNRNAQNAILKILEEPPANVLIILIAHRLGMLIPTIHSRSRKISFLPLTYPIINTLINKRNDEDYISTRDIETLTDMAEGSFGKTLKYIENNCLEMLSTILEHLEHARNGDLYKIHEFSASISTPAQDTQYHIFSQILQWIIRKIVLLKARGTQNLPAYIYNNTTHDLFNNYSLERLSEITLSLKNNFESVDFSNLDRRDAVRAAFLMINQ